MYFACLNGPYIAVNRSTDGGQNFTALGVNSKVPTNPNYFNPNMNLMHGQAWYNQMIVADPFDSTGNTLYAGGNYSSAMSSDGGDTWTLLTGWLGQYGYANFVAKGKAKNMSSQAGAKLVGALVAKRALAKNIQTVVFDRGGRMYHGAIKALAESAREAGLKF